MTDKEKIRAEIERRIKFQKECIKNSYRLTGKPEEEIILEYKQLLSFIDSLPEEPVSEDLEEAANNYADKNRIELTDNETGEVELCKSIKVYNAFKAGAQWQLNKLPRWKKAPTGGCWSGEIAVHPSLRQFRYEHYVINADKLFKLLEKEE